MTIEHVQRRATKLLDWVATERERQLTTGKRTERTKRDFHSQMATLPLVKPVVRFARPFVNWRSRSVAKSAYLTYLA